MKIKKAQFIKGIVEGDLAWDQAKPQVIFYGRSNAGKSSTLNALVNNKNFAKVSSSAGKTREINLFNINDDFHLIDLPGYGFAKGSKAQREKLDELITWFMTGVSFDKRINVIIIDSQVGLTEIDMEVLELLYRTNTPIILLLNKCDKLNQSQSAKVLNNTYANVAGMVSVLMFSAKEKKGTEKLWKAIESHL